MQAKLTAGRARPFGPAAGAQSRRVCSAGAAARAVSGLTPTRPPLSVAASMGVQHMTSSRHSNRRGTLAAAAAADAADAAAPAAVAPMYSGKRAVVVGAGPAGSTAAMFLAKQGFSVDVFERRPEPKDDAVDTGRAYIIIVIPRGQDALKQLGVPLPTEAEYVTKGTVRHGKDGRVGISREEGNVTFSRSGLAQYMINQARAQYPKQITFTFNAACTGVDINARQASFNVDSSSGGSSSGGGASGSVVQPYDLLVGADGVGSAVRQALQAFYPDMSVVVTDSGREYKTYGGVRGDIEPPEFQGSPGATLHLYTTGDPWTTLTAHRNPDDTYSGTFSLKTGGFAGLHTQDDYEQLISANFSGFPAEWVPAVAQQALKESPSPAGKRVKCSRLDGPRVLLLGDAAHAVTPVFGQGANSALESCKVLGAVLEQSQGRLDDVPAEFSAARLADMHALNELDAKAYAFFRRRGLLDTDFLQLLCHVLLGTLLSKLLPFLYGDKPALLKLGSTIPYSDITRAVRRDSLLAAVGFAALGLWLSFKLAVKLFAGA